MWGQGTSNVPKKRSNLFPVPEKRCPPTAIKERNPGKKGEERGLSRNGSEKNRVTEGFFIKHRKRRVGVRNRKWNICGEEKKEKEKRGGLWIGRKSGEKENEILLSNCAQKGKRKNRIPGKQREKGRRAQNSGSLVQGITHDKGRDFALFFSLTPPQTWGKGSHERGKA